MASFLAKGHITLGLNLAGAHSIDSICASQVNPQHLHAVVYTDVALNGDTFGLINTVLSCSPQERVVLDLRGPRQQGLGKTAKEVTKNKLLNNADCCQVTRATEAI